MFCLKPIIWEICKKQTKTKTKLTRGGGGGGPIFYHRFIYKYSSLLWLFIADPQSVNYKVIQRWVGVVFCCLEWECCTFQNIDENSFKSTNTILLGIKNVTYMYTCNFLWINELNLLKKSWLVVWIGDEEEYNYDDDDDNNKKNDFRWLNRVLHVHKFLSLPFGQVKY